MKLDLKTDTEFQNKKQEIEERVDDIINSSKLNLSTKIREELKDENEDIIKKALELIDEDLEEKRINIKEYFVSQIETITVKAFKNAIAKIMA